MFTRTFVWSRRLRSMSSDPADDRVRVRRDSDTPPNEQGRTGWVAYNPIVYEGSYSPMVDAPERDVEPGIVSPPPSCGEVDVWLTEWQVAEDHFAVVVGETVAWKLVPMDHDWITRLFESRRTVPLQLDMYAEATRGENALDWTEINGVVVRLDQVSVQYVQSNDPAQRGLFPQRGAAVVHTVSSIWPVQPHHGHLSGWIVRIRLGRSV